MHEIWPELIKALDIIRLSLLTRLKCHMEVRENIPGLADGGGGSPFYEEGAKCVPAVGDQFQPSRESLCQDTGDKNQISDSRGTVWI